MLHQAQPKPLLALGQILQQPYLRLALRFHRTETHLRYPKPRGSTIARICPGVTAWRKASWRTISMCPDGAKVPFPEAKAWAEPYPLRQGGTIARGRPQYATSPFPAARRPSSRGTTQTRQATRERHRSRKQMGASAKQRFEARGYPEVLGSGQQPIQESLLVPSIGSIQKETKTIHFNAIKEQEKTTLPGSTSCRRMCRKGGFPCLSNVIHNA